MAIRQLDEITIAKIAAGEVVLSPVCALKELMENSLDAGATLIEITLKDGGLSMLQVKDNGGGILYDDLPLLCERFTTSKLHTIADLSALTTFGFRGEALASISHVALVTVCTKTRDGPSGFKAEYLDGKLLAAPRVYPMETGTTISAEKMFEQWPQRRDNLGTGTELFLSALKIVQKYAIQYANVQFTIGGGDKRQTLTTSGSSSKLQLLQLIFEHPSFDSEIIPIACTSGDVVVEGLISNANYSRSSSEFILFINGRLVESESLQATVTKTYLTLLPNIAHFVYLSLSVPPATLDPNVHPTKREVKFMAELEAFTAIQQCIESEFNKSQQQCTLSVRTIMPSASRKGVSSQVRVNCNDSQLDWTIKKLEPVQNKETEQLLSVYELKEAITGDQGIQAIFDEFTFVGACDKERVMLQYRTGLYLVHVPTVLQELAYQYILSNFAKLPAADVGPIDIASLLSAAIQEPWARFDPASHGPSEHLVSCMVATFDNERIAAMLLEYFSLQIVERMLVKIPVVCAGNLVGNMEKLGEMMIRLTTDVEWDLEKECIDGAARVISKWFSQFPDIYEDKLCEDLYRTQVFPYLRGRLKVDSRSIALGGAVTKLVSTEELYQIFERC